jgi:acyl carrier protein
MDELLSVLTTAKPVVDAETFMKAKDLYGEGIIDSLDIMIILDEINHVYGINIGSADFTRGDFRTVADIHNLIKRHKKT